MKLQGVVKGETENVCGKGKREADKSSMPWREIVVHVGRLLLMKMDSRDTSVGQRDSGSP